MKTNTQNKQQPKNPKQTQNPQLVLFFSSNNIGDHTYLLVTTGLVAGDWRGVESFVKYFGNPKQIFHHDKVVVSKTLVIYYLFTRAMSGRKIFSLT